MHVEFTKMHGAGNDFILIDNRDAKLPLTDPQWICSISARHTGVGCDGVILVEKPTRDVDFRMRFINPDGNEVDMCGNGARCVARYAVDRKIAPETMVFETLAGNVRASVLKDGRVTIGLSPISDWQRSVTVAAACGVLSGQWLNTGVPHAVFQVEDVASFDVVTVGRQVRYDDQFLPTGTNADFFQQLPNGDILVRTYERGVEDETLACGTGIAATALSAIDLGLVQSPVSLICRSGDRLEVTFDVADPASVTLTGPAAYVFEGRTICGPSVG